MECSAYILGVREDIDSKELAEIAGQISKEGGELVMTAAERLREEGLKMGIEKGELARSRQIAKDMIIDGEPAEKIMKYTKLSIKEFNEIKDEMKNL